MKKLYRKHYILLVFSILILSGCSERLVVASSGEGLSFPPVEFTLITNTVDGELVYVGAGGDIDGLVNPDLIVQPGSRVIITLLNGDGIQHNLTIPDFDFQAPLVSRRSDKVGVVFEVGDESSGNYPYFCSVPGHHQAGMEGRLVVNQP